MSVRFHEKRLCRLILPLAATFVLLSATFQQAGATPSFGVLHGAMEAGTPECWTPTGSKPPKFKKNKKKTTANPTNAKSKVGVSGRTTKHTTGKHHTRPTTTGVSHHHGQATKRSPNEAQAQKTKANARLGANASPAPIRVGQKDLVYGTHQTIKSFTEKHGGVRLIELPNKNALPIRNYATSVLGHAARTGRQVHFVLDGMSNVRGVLANRGPHKDSVTAHELRYIKKHWQSFKVKPKFYQKGVEVPAPW